MDQPYEAYKIERCFGHKGCRHRILSSDWLSEKLAAWFQMADLADTCSKRGIGELKAHHLLRVAVTECPNACAQPQIKDIGIIAACRPLVTQLPCSGCRACETTCKESAIELTCESSRPRIDNQRCLACGQCLTVCPTGTLIAQARGYRIQIGGKLGRHPQLAIELPGIYTAQSVITIVTACLDLYKAKNRPGERIGTVLSTADVNCLAADAAAQRIW